MAKRWKSWSASEITELRIRLGMDREKFAEHINASEWTVKWWEYGRGKPNGPTCRLFDFLSEQLEKGQAPVACS